MLRYKTEVHSSHPLKREREEDKIWEEKNLKKCRKEGSLFNGPVQLELHAFEAKVQKGSSSSFFFNGKERNSITR